MPDKTPPLFFVPVQEYPGQRLHLVREVSGELAETALCGRGNTQTHAWQRALIPPAPGTICRSCLRVQAAKKGAMMSESNTKPVLVTTEHRGVFFGFLESRNGNSVVLQDARCAIYWNTKGGFLELAKIGPNDGSRVGSAAPRLELFDVTSIADVTPEAVEKWQAA